MAKSSKTIPAVRPSPGRRRANAERTGASRANDLVESVAKGRAPRTAVRAAASGNGDWTPPRDEVARRAYDLFLQRGCSHGSDLEDWLEAERQVRTAHGR